MMKMILTALVVIVVALGMFVSQAQTAEPLYLAINEIGWSGTVHSAADEWIELYNAAGNGMAVGGAYIELVMSDTTTRTIMLPDFEIGINEYVLFERTDGTVTTAPETGIYVGALPNEGVVAMRLRFWDHLISDEILMPDGWSAGSTIPRASMQRLAGTDQWFTSTVGHVFDANEQYVLGTPGFENDTPTDPSCDYIPVLGNEFGFDISFHEDSSHQPYVWYVVQMGDGTMFTAQTVWTGNSWVNGEEGHGDEVTLSCELLAHDYQQSVTNILNAQPGVARLDDQFVMWLNDLRRFQSSALHQTYLPIVQS